MKKLNRADAPEPECLKTLAKGPPQWDRAREYKQPIWTSLEAMQGTLCAYCEGDLRRLGKHIEHFRARDKFPGLMFRWSNLFGSCEQSDSCGIYKDRHGKPYSPDDLISPDIDDPDRSFRFRTDGSIDIRPGLQKTDEHRAQETLRVFNLNPRHGRLRFDRRRTWKQYDSQEPDLLKTLEGLDPAERAQWLEDELKAVAGQEHSTVIRHFLKEMISQ